MKRRRNPLKPPPSLRRSKRPWWKRLWLKRRRKRPRRLLKRPKPLPPLEAAAGRSRCYRSCAGNARRTRTDRSLASRRPFRRTPPAASRSQPSAASGPPGSPAGRRCAGRRSGRRGWRGRKARPSAPWTARPSPRFPKTPRRRAGRGRCRNAGCRRCRTGRRAASHDQGRPPRERFEGKGRDRDNNRDNDRTKGKFGGDRNKERGGRDKGGRDFGGRDKGLARAAADSSKPVASPIRHQRRAARAQTGRSIRIRRSPSLRP